MPVAMARRGAYNPAGWWGFVLIFRHPVIGSNLWYTTDNGLEE